MHRAERKDVRGRCFSCPYACLRGKKERNRKSITGDANRGGCCACPTPGVPSGLGKKFHTAKKSAAGECG